MAATYAAWKTNIPGVGLFQRFLVMNDRTVGRFLVRDCDARVSAAEADLVQRWIAGGYPFHVVRDHVLYNELMIGCLWAGRTDCRIDIVALMRRYFAGAPTAKYGHDQRMLGLMLWPLIRSCCWFTTSIIGWRACTPCRSPIRRADAASATRTSRRCCKRSSG